ncbi:ABC transporter substrate-binding protein [Acinetobacter sp. CFCC 10889]|uniref:ABC transporter substrate-binding protein n=1 Tax=Acinetobacter sp. CFCC 10889 TaxID=1775557 RepID=UPI000DD04FA0|nr:ABC transporter substrate-binding protein [Acinetobacter sp. CFCC 10889]
MNHLEKTDIQLGYVPLLDCIALLWAQHQGYFAEQGLNVTLVKEASWASLRDRLAFGFLDTAHCLSTMLPAAMMGSDHIGIPFQTPLVLSVNRAFISISQKLCFDLNISTQDSPKQSAEKIVQAIQQQQTIHLAHVFKYSIHHYCLREWLALADQHIAQSAKLLTFPPPYMVESIAKHTIDGFCVGEPWNIQAEIQGYSHVIAESKAIIPEVADKVLAVTQDWAIQYPATLNALCTAIMRAQQDLQQMSTIDSAININEVWKILVDYNIIRFDCSESVHVPEFHKIQHIIQHFVSQDATPKASDFEWMIGQMQKWEHVNLDHQNIAEIAQRCIVIH